MPATAVFSFFLTLAGARAQAPAPRPNATAITPASTYDVMSIKRNRTASGNVDIDTDDGRFSAINVSLKALLAQIYDVRQDLISGIPGPVESARFDIEAKIVEPDREVLKNMTREQRRIMLLPLVTERFQLKTHTETKTLPIYELVVTKGGPKCKPSADQTKTDGDSISTSGSRTQVKLSAHDATMAAFAEALSRRVDRTVIDKTGLTGNFDLEMQWSTENNPDSGVEPLPSLFTAIQEQLGLKLQPAKGPVETLVVDQAAMPSEN